MPDKLKVGQALWYVSRYGMRQGYEVTVEKAGRKWATLSNRDKVDVYTLDVQDNYNASVYLSEEHYRETIPLEKLRRQFQQAVGHYQFKATRAQIEAAAADLGIELNNADGAS